MAVTAHWMDEYTLQSGQTALRLRSALIGFYWVPGSHSGQHLCEALVKVIERVGIMKMVRHFFELLSVHFEPNILKLGWFTMDNAKPNDTMIEALEEVLREMGITNFRWEERITIYIQPD